MKKDPNRKSFHLLSKSVGNVNLIDLLISMETGSRPRGGVKKITSGIPSIGGEHLNASGGFDFSNIKYVPHSFVEKMTRGRIQKNDILIVKDGATTGKTSFVGNNFPFETAYVDEHVFICRPSSYINPKYLFWFLWSLEGNKKILENFKGSAQGGINTTFASNCKIPLLSIENQNNLVSYIDEQISKVQSAKN
ncbi:MAG: restriction endonuclease subunit S, partial [Nitrososphaeraceae archaeon]